MKQSIIFTTVLVLFFIHSLSGQTPYEEGGNTRFRFAQTTIGGDLRYTPQGGNSYFINSNGTTEEFSLGNSAWGRFVISGWHFWGHMDFYLALPLFKLTDNTFGDNSEGNFFYNNGIETGMKIYPSRIKDGKIRPYVGASFNNTVFWQQYNDQKYQNLSRNTFPLQAGLTYVKGKSIFDIGLTYNYANQTDYYISPTQTAQIELPRYNISVGYRTYFDVSEKDEADLLSGKLDKLAKKMKSDKKANSWSLALGLSSPFYLNNDYNTRNLAYIGDFRFSNSFFDLGLGYYLHKPDLHFNLAFRNYKNRLDAFGADQVYHRTSIGLEAFKFLFDYKGFVPFVGPIVSYDINRMNVTLDGNPYTAGEERGTKVGIVFGWDIRQDEVQYATLRTNLRYYPFYNFNIEGERYRFDKLEFNLIQFVFYPTRYKWIKKNKPKVKG